MRKHTNFLRINNGNNQIKVLLNGFYLNGRTLAKVSSTDLKVRTKKALLSNSHLSCISLGIKMLDIFNVVAKVLSTNLTDCNLNDDFSWSQLENLSKFELVAVGEHVKTRIFPK